MARGDYERKRLKALVEGRDWATLGDKTATDTVAEEFATRS
jgi:hypothetical protein